VDYNFCFIISKYIPWYRIFVEVVYELNMNNNNKIIQHYIYQFVHYR